MFFLTLFHGTIHQNLNTSLGTVKIGIVLPNTNNDLVYWQGYPNSAAAVTKALEVARENDTLLRRVNFEFVWTMNECVASEAAGELFDLINLQKIQALFGPPCSSTANVATNIAEYYDIPLYLFSTSGLKEVTDFSMYTVVASVMPSYSDFVIGLARLLIKFEWTNVAIVTYETASKLNRCGLFYYQADQKITRGFDQINVVYQRNMVNFSPDSLKKVTDDIKKFTRVIIICMGDMDKFRSFILAAYDNGMNTSDYVYINCDVDMDIYVNEENKNAMIDYKSPPDGRDKEAIKAAGELFDLINVQKIQVLFGPPCYSTANVAMNIATYYNIPLYLFGTSSLQEIADFSLYNVVTSVMPSYSDFVIGLARLLIRFEWTNVAIVAYETESKLNRCGRFYDQADQRITQGFEQINVVYQRNIVNFSSDSLKKVTGDIKKLARVIVVCMDEIDKLRSFMLAAYDNGMNTSDYVYINCDVDMDIYINEENKNAMIDYKSPPDGRDEEAISMYKWMFHLHFSALGGISSQYNDFRATMPKYMREPPFNCTTECAKYNVSSAYAPYLFDSAYLYFISLGLAMNSYGNNPNATSIADNGTLVTTYSSGVFNGMTGAFQISKNLTRDSRLSFSTYFNNGLNTTRWIYLLVVGNDAEFNISYTDLATTMFAVRGGATPLNIPKCGYQDEFCQPSFIEKSPVGFAFIIVGGVLILVVIIALMIYLCIMKKKEEEKQNELWRMYFGSVIKYSDYKGSIVQLQSKRSLLSTSQTSTKQSFKDKSSGRHQLYVLHTEPIMGRIHDVQYTLRKKDMLHLRQLRMLDNENINKFIGFCLDGPILMSFWRYCSRLSFLDILTNENLNITMDGFFVYSLIKDTVEGLSALHNSPIEVHGNLSSKNCLVDERWQVKLSDFGLPFIRCHEKHTVNDQIWTAPEILREEISTPTKSSDIYSLGIVLADVVNKNIAFENSDIRGGADEIIYMLKKKRGIPLRPVLKPAVENISPALLHLIKDMWSEEPGDRPKSETVKKLVKEMNPGKSNNLMDHVYGILENYAANLEEEIQERTKELIEEKKKADMLLSRMLPKQVAEKLKLGQPILPEQFDQVTIFFSDVVSFTTLAARCTPMQVVSLLNNLYTTFDSIINEHDVYKVETIGDGYLCVSGLPHRNGVLHVKEIALLSINLIKSLENFTIQHLPKEKIKIRVGMHTGSCVAGVVGLTMPRYCLFGDTVNTASRMESNGKPNHIHISNDAHKLLTEKIGGFVTEPRGEVLIKGKGVMETFWLVGKVGEDPADPNNGMYADYKKESS
uniref:Guanylate cyclase n=1 Tax=Strongyloides venezuelensis TaxID=75913 RepID=A0A0K0FCE1_STRVS